MNEQWRQYSACQGHPTWWWYRRPGGRLAGPHLDALRICEACPVRTACLEHALATPEEIGLWGGIPEKQRHRMRARRLAVERGER